MSSYRDLVLWKETQKLTKDVYAVAYKLPNYELYALSSQIRRAVISIGSNIAEGAGRGRTKDYIHFLYNAKGSAYEVEAQLYLSVGLGFITEENADEAIHQEKRVSWMLTRLIHSLEMKARKADSIYKENVDFYGDYKSLETACISDLTMILDWISDA
jgi:four helix bundle protein